MKIAIASGKGGTGKTTVATNLAYLLSMEYKEIVLVDLDVEEPNCHLFYFYWIQHKSGEHAHVLVPKINQSLCTSCGQCVQFCNYNALCIIGRAPEFSAMVFHELCHSCGGCTLICPNQAISEVKRPIGNIVSEDIVVADGAVVSAGAIKLFYGLLNVGEAKSPPLIALVKQHADQYNTRSLLEISDCPPGTSCAAMKSIENSDIVFLVTEPTAFGRNDLALAIDMVNCLSIPMKIIINKSDENDDLIEELAAQRGVEIIAKIPHDIEMSKIYSSGRILADNNTKMDSYLSPILSFIRKSERGDVR
ncbi:MAG: ATP-binding protein [Oligoflexia bacterium]|nr:ATP-binding protein [Oligoflexia bacterium]